MTPANLAQPELQNETKIPVKRVKKNTTSVTRVRVLRKVKSGMFDAPEIVAMSIAGITLIGVIYAYFFMLLPARDEFQKREVERSQKQTQLSDLQAKSQLAGTNAAGTVDLMSSVERFESNFLPLGINGNAALYQRLNELIRSNGLRNTAGPQYSSLEMIDASKAAKINERRGGGKQPSIFPGTYVTVTVEGNYASLRHFISDLESTKQYLVINTVEIEPNGNGENNNATVTNNGGASGAAFPKNPNGIVPTGVQNGFPNAQMQSGKVNPRLNNNSAATAPPASVSSPSRRGSVSLQLEMAAYFRRPMAIQN
jgi:hypothetical protein